MKRFHTLQLSVLLLFGCTAQNDGGALPGKVEVPRGPITEATAGKPCSVPLRKGVLLTQREACVLQLIQKRCGEHDDCLSHCLSNEEHRTRYTDGNARVVGGGCDHLCWGYAERHWQPPDGYSNCMSLPANEYVGELPTR